MFLRLFFHRPSVAFLDEASSAVSVEVEDALMQKCRELEITLVSVGHRESLKRHHHRLLKLEQSTSGWKIENLEREA